MLRGLSGERDGGECNGGLVEGKHRGNLCAGVEQLNNCCGALVEGKHIYSGNLYSRLKN